MPGDRKGIRGVVLSEDKRTERFFRRLLTDLGFERRRFRFETAPARRGAAEAWVAERYPNEVKVLRSKIYQDGLRLVAVRDGDEVGLVRRKHQLDKTLRNSGLDERQDDEGIATPVPTRNIETWLLALNGVDSLDETEDYKHRFEEQHRHGNAERDALRAAAAAWQEIRPPALPSLLDGKTEMERLDP